MRDLLKMAIRPLMKYHGAKWYLAPWIIEHMPKHNTYVEVFGGSAAILLNKTPAKHEVYNDKNDIVVNLFRVIRDDDMRDRLIKLVSMTPYSRTEYHHARLHYEDDDPVLSAHKLLIRSQMAFGSSGATTLCAGFKSYTAGEGGASIKSLWTNMPDNLLQVANRLRKVLIENTDACKLIKQHDRSNTLFYLDPPYPAETRENITSYRDYEFDDNEHEELLTLAKSCKGDFLISGYDNELYNDILKGWVKSSKLSTISSQKGSVMRTEILWLSPNCQSNQLDFFD